MKPIIIYQETKDEKIILTKKEFEKYLEDAYQAGYLDGNNKFTATIPVYREGVVTSVHSNLN